METHRRLLRGPFGWIWLLASLGLAIHGVGRQHEAREARRAAHEARDRVAAVRAATATARESLLAEYSGATQGAEAGSKPKILPKYAALLEGELGPLQSEWTAAENSWKEADRLLAAGEFRATRASCEAAESLYGHVLSARLPALHAIIGRIRDAGPKAREALGKFDAAEAAARGDLEAIEKQEVPGLREKYQLSDSECRFRLPEARQLLQSAREHRDRAQSLLDTPVEPYGIPDEPEAREMAVRAVDLCSYAVTAGKKRVESSRLCNERYDILKGRLKEWETRKGEAGIALQALWAEHLPRYIEGIPEKIAKADSSRAAADTCLAAEIQRYRAQDFDGGLALLDQALEILRAAYAEFASVGELLVELNRCRSEFASVQAQASAEMEAARSYIAAHAGDVSPGLPLGGDALAEAVACHQRREWLEAVAAVQTARRTAAESLETARRQVCAAETARREAEEAAERARRDAEESSRRSLIDDSSSSSSDWGSSSSDWDSSSSDSGGSWGDSGSDSGW